METNEGVECSTKCEQIKNLSNYLLYNQWVKFWWDLAHPTLSNVLSLPLYNDKIMIDLKIVLVTTTESVSSIYCRLYKFCL
jgi:hypothetical protein